MAPMTRRRAAAQQTKVATPNEKKRRSLNPLEVADTPKKSTPKVTPKRKRLAVRARGAEEPAEEAQSAQKKNKRKSIPKPPTPVKSAEVVEEEVKEVEEDAEEDVEGAEDDAGDYAEDDAEDDGEGDGEDGGEDDAEEDDDEDVEQTPNQLARQLEEEASQQRAVEPSPRPAAAKNKSKHITFGGDDDVDQFVSAAAEAAEKSEPAATADDNEEESDDEAPEAVSTSAAAAQTQRAAQAATEAAEKQAATLKRKRQKRDDLLKQQAEKRKRTEKPETKEPEADQDGDAPEVEKSTTAGRKRVDKFSLPSVLPAEFLTDSESESEDGRALVAQRPKKIKFDDALQSLKKEGLAPKDEIVGTTAYRVMADHGNQKLAPKANHNSKSVKEMLLHRRRVGVPAIKGRGFFRRK